MIHITITGDLASGKSTVAKLIAEKLPAKYFSTGQMQRDLASEMGMTTLELNKYSEKHPDIDKKIDGKTKDLANFNENLIVDSRMAWYFLPKSLKIYLSVDDAVAAKRVMADNIRSGEPKYNDEKDAIKKLKERKESENKRYITLYGTDCSDMKNYDIIIDSSFANQEEIIELIVSIAEGTKEESVNRYFVSPEYLYPMEDVRSLIMDDAVRLGEVVRKNGFDSKCPIEVVQYESRYFIWDGHKRVSASIRNNLPFVPVTVIAQDNEDILPGLSVASYVSKTYRQSTTYDWEEALGISYLEIF